tara:strand:+ start:8637 stop:10262 length:1626 start_codon:yes stop_codon:yes gene_type:complete
MATHDYILDNASGAAFRTDLNNALAAIVSNNSNGSSPATTYAYQWWADTSSGILKIRNSSNNGWVELLQLDGTLTLEDGNVSAPALAFRDDLNTGIYSSAADTFNVATGGVERMELGASTIFNEDGADVDFRIEGDTEANLFCIDAGNNRVGIGTNTPNELLNIHGSGDTQINISSDSDQFKISCFSNGDAGLETVGSFPIRFFTASQERARIDSSGNILKGITTARAGFFHSVVNPGVQIEGAGDFDRQMSITSSSSTANFGSVLILARQRSGSVGGNTIVQAGDSIGLCSYQANDGTNFIEAARIEALVASGVGGNDMPTELVFSTNSGTTSVTQRMIIDSSGNVMIGVTSASAKFHVDNGGSGNVAFLKHSSSGIAVTLTLQNNRATGSLAGEQISFLDDSGTQRGKITSTTSETAYVTSSDYRLKENNVPISDGIERVKQLKPYKFNWKHVPDRTVDGFFAHEVQDLVIGAVDGTKDKVVTQADKDAGDYLDKEVGTEIHQMIDHSKIVPLLTAAIKEAVAKIEVLETKVAILEAAQ